VRIKINSARGEAINIFFFGEVQSENERLKGNSKCATLCEFVDFAVRSDIGGEKGF
jgi:hypothetical protein